jgi:ABC-type lipoprotein export system ATPase subunit
MFVNKLCFRGLKNLTEDIPPDSDLSEPARKRLLFQGPNGSGKSTILETIFQLWRMFGDWIDSGETTAVPGYLESSLLRADLAAVEFRGFDKSLDRLWIGAGVNTAWNQFMPANQKPRFVALVRFEGENRKPRFETRLPAYDFRSLRQRVLVGKVKRPNVVYFPAEMRMLPARETERAQLVYLQEYLWAAEFNPQVDLDGLLTTVKAHDPTRYEFAMELINRLLMNQRKKLVLRHRAPRHEVEILRDGQESVFHSQQLLSSGEKQMVLMVGFAACVLQEGGVLIIDEPDLHIHVALIQPLLSTFYHITQERKGQLIVAAHSQQVWSWFTQSAERISLSPWRGGRKT